jgi:histidine triad (HIT) family protein
MSDVFCRIAGGESPAYRIYEDEEVMAILDIYPLALGQTLVIPRVHFTWFYEIPDELIPHFYRVVKYVGRAIKDSLNPEAVSIIVRGMRVPHYHVILVPVFGNDVVSSMFGIMDAAQGFPKVELSVLEERYRELWRTIERYRTGRGSIMNFEEVRERITSALDKYLHLIRK